SLSYRLRRDREQGGCMPRPLLDQAAIDRAPDVYLASVGAVFAMFDSRTQDSGNCSYGVRVAEERFFVKTAGDPEDRKPLLTHAARVALLRTAARLHASCRPPNLPPLLNLIESPLGPLLVYPWVEGELLGVPRARRDDPESPFQRFKRLPAA